MFLHVASSTRTSYGQCFREHRQSSYIRLELKQHLLLILQPPTPQPPVLPLIPAQKMNTHSKQWAQSHHFAGIKWNGYPAQEGISCLAESIFNEQELYMFFKSCCKTGWDAVSKINIWNMQEVSVGMVNVEGKWIHTVSWRTKDVPIHKGRVLSSWKTDIN